MAGDTATTLASFFKTYYRDTMNTDVPNASDMGRMIEAEAREITAGGTSLNVTWNNKSADGVGIGTITDGGDYPAAQYSVPLQYALGLSHIGFTVSFTGHSEAMGTSAKAGWIKKKLAKEKGKELRDKARSLLARFFMWDGTTTWGTIGAVSGTTNGLITPSGIPIHFFQKQEVLTIRDTASGGSEQLTGAAGSGRIVEVDELNGVVYCADVTGAATSDVISLANVYDTTVPNGIRNIVDSGGAIQGVTRTTVGNFMAKAIERDASSAALSPSRVDELRDLVMDQASKRGNYKTRWCGNRKMRRWATLATIGQNRFANLSLSIGNASMTVNDKDGPKEFVEDQYIADGELYAICANALVKAYPEGMKGGYPVENASGGVLWQANASSGAGHADNRFMYWVVRCNLGADDFRCHGKDTNLASP